MLTGGWQAARAATIRVSRYDGASYVGFDVELEFDLDSEARRSENVSGSISRWKLIA